MKSRKGWRKLSAKELADLHTNNWKNASVDTTKYSQCILKAYEVSKYMYGMYRDIGGLCQIHNNKYYIA